MWDLHVIRAVALHEALGRQNVGHGGRVRLALHLVVVSNNSMQICTNRIAEKSPSGKAAIRKTRRALAKNSRSCGAEVEASSRHRIGYTTVAWKLSHAERITEAEYTRSFPGAPPRRGPATGDVPQLSRLTCPAQSHHSMPSPAPRTQSVCPYPGCCLDIARRSSSMCRVQRCHR